MELFIISFFGLMAWHIISELLHRHERDKLLNRIMARNYEEYQYYEKKYEGDLKALNKIREEVLPESEPIREVPEDVKRFVGNLEEDWPVDTLDIDKLKSLRIDKEIENESSADRE